jgi:DNA-binding transcriptional LysR family regulator
MSKLPDLEAWAIFAKLVETGSFARTATELGLSTPTVSKAVARLEAKLGAALLNRTSRRLSLTATGRMASAGAARLLAEAEAAEAAALSEATQPRGPVRIAAPMSFGVAHLAPMLPALLAEHPGITIDLHLDDAVVDLIGGGFDLALRIAALADSTLRTRRICGMRRLLVGAPAYFARAGQPAHPADLAGHACLGYANLPQPGRWPFVNAAGQEVTVMTGGPLRCNNGEALLPAVLAGQGLAVLPEFMVWAQIGAGMLEAAMPDWSLPPIGLNIVTPPGGLRPARVTLVIDFLARRLAAAPWAGVAG